VTGCQVTMQCGVHLGGDPTSGGDFMDVHIIGLPVSARRIESGTRRNGYCQTSSHHMLCFAQMGCSKGNTTVDVSFTVLLIMYVP